MVYYLVFAYKKEVDEQYHSHLYPCYLTSYDLKLGGKNFGLQRGFHDALKFVLEKDAETFMERAVQTFGERYEFEVVPLDARVFGRAKLMYVIDNFAG